MNKIFISTILGALISIASYGQDESVPYQYNSRLVDYRLLYPLIDVQDYQGANAVIPVHHKGRNGLGLALSYNFYKTRFIGLNIEPMLWFTPLSVDSARKYFGVAVLSAGISLRPLPKTYFDPTLTIQSGLGLMRSGGQIPSKVVYPTGVLASLAIYRENTRFEDDALSLCLQGGFYRYFHALEFLKPNVIQIGLAIRGSF